MYFKRIISKTYNFQWYNYTVITPNDFFSRSEVKERLFGFQERYQEVAEPFEWKFTRADLDRLCAKLSYNDEAEKRELVTSFC